MKKIIFCLAIIEVITLISLWQWVKNSETANDRLLESLDSINSQINLLQTSRDSLQIIVDTSKGEVIKVERNYEKAHKRIITQSVDSDCVTFTKHLSKHQQRLFNSNNSDSIKNR